MVAQLPGHLKIHVVFKQDAGGKGHLLLLQGTVAGHAEAAAPHHEDLRRPFGAGQLHAAEEQVVGAVLDLIKPVDLASREQLLRRTEPGDGIPLDAQKVVGDLHGQVDLMQGHDHRNTLLPGHFPENIQQLDLMADIQIGGRLVQDDDLGLLADGPGQHDPLALAVAEGGEVPLLQLQGVDPLQGLTDDALVGLGQFAQGVGVGIAAHRHHFAAGHQFRTDPVGKHHRHLPGHLPGRPGVYLPPADVHHAAQLGQMAGDGLEDGGLPRPVGADQREDRPLFDLDADVVYEHLPVIAHGQIFRFEISHRSLLLLAPAAAQHHPDDHRRAKGGGDGADGQLGGRKRRTGDQVAENAKHRAAQIRDRDDQHGPGGLEQGAGDMGHRDPHKGNRTGKGGDTGGEQAGEQDEQRSEELDVDAQAPGVPLSQRIGPDGLAQKPGRPQSQQADPRRGGHAAPVRPGKAAHGPAGQVDDVLLLGKGDAEVGDGAADIAHHDADDQQHRHAMYPLGEDQHDARDEQGACKGGEDHDRRADPAEIPAEEDHGDPHHHLGPRGDPQYEGSGNGVAEEGLEQKPGDGERAPQNGGQQHPGHPDAENDLALGGAVQHRLERLGVSAAGKHFHDLQPQSIPHHTEYRSGRDLYGACIDIQHQTPGQQSGQDRHHGRKAPDSGQALCAPPRFRQVRGGLHSLVSDNAGNIYVSNYNSGNVVKINPSGVASVLVSKLDKPYGLHVEGNMLFITCQGSNSIMRQKL